MYLSRFSRDYGRGKCVLNAACLVAGIIMASSQPSNKYGSNSNGNASSGSSSSSSSNSSSRGSTSHRQDPYERYGLRAGVNDQHSGFMVGMVKNNSKNYTTISWCHANDGTVNSPSRGGVNTNVRLHGNEKPYKIVYTTPKSRTEFYPKPSK